MNYWLTHNTTTGEKYHTLCHCMSGDQFWIYALIFFLTLTVLQYLNIAWRAWKKSREFEKTTLGNTFMNFILVFIFCATAGYLFREFQMFWPGYKFLIILLVILNIVTYNFRQGLKRTDFFGEFFGMNTKVIKLEVKVLKLKNELAAYRTIANNNENEK